jgi:hypothetical protein
VALPSPTELSPPFDLTADMLFVGSLMPTAALKSAFPRQEFFSLFGRTPLVLWFSTVREGCYWDERGQRQCLGGPSDELYDEVNILAVLRKRRLFCPAIYATSELSVGIARLYGMPKELLMSIDFEEQNRQLSGDLRLAGRTTFVRAKIAGLGGIVGRLVSRFWPVWSWPVDFPSGSSVRALIKDTPQVRSVSIRQGKLDLPLEWLQKPVSFFRPAVYIRQLRMQLPPP